MKTSIFKLAIFWSEMQKLVEETKAEMVSAELVQSNYHQAITQAEQYDRPLQKLGTLLEGFFHHYLKRNTLFDSFVSEVLKEKIKISLDLYFGAQAQLCKNNIRVGRLDRAADALSTARKIASEFDQQQNEIYQQMLFNCRQVAGKITGILQYIHIQQSMHPETARQDNRQEEASHMESMSRTALQFMQVIKNLQ